MHIMVTYFGLGVKYFSSLDEIIFPKRVYAISCSDNNLTNLEGMPCNLPNIQGLAFRNNNLTSLKGLPNELPNLQKLCCINNLLTSFEGLPNELPSLISIQADNNNFSFLKWFPKIDKKFQNLFLRRNRIKYLDGYQFVNIIQAIRRPTNIFENNNWKRYPVRQIIPLHLLALKNVKEDEVRGYHLRKYYRKCQKCQKIEVCYKRVIYIEGITVKYDICLFCYQELIAD